MTAPSDTPTTPATAVVPARPLSPAAAEAKAVREMTVAIRGQQWGAGCSPEVQYAVARYCYKNGLDAVRHVEVLGGRIYLTAEFYREAGSELLLDGTVVPEEPQLIHADARLDVLAKGDDEQATWARTERDTRLRARIQYGVDEESPAAAVVRFRLKSGAVIVGVNWIQGPGGKKRDPVGQAEPTKTAITRAERRAWRQVVEAVPSFRDKVQPIEASAKLATAEVAEVITTEVAAQVTAVAEQRRLGSAGIMGGATYGEPTPAAEPAPIDEAERLASLAREQVESGLVHLEGRTTEERTPDDERFEVELDK